MLLPLVLMVLTACAVASGFQCSIGFAGLPSGRNSVAANYQSLNGLYVFDWPCQCDYDWKEVFCNRLEVYKRVPAAQAPSVCICRQLDTLKRDCHQFMTRCFLDQSANVISRKSHCACCFKQPDSHCHQLDCQDMKPDFGRDTNVSCLCYTRADYPDWVCGGGSGAEAARPRLFYSRAADQQQQQPPLPPQQGQAIAFAANASRQTRFDGLGARQTRHWFERNALLIPLMVAASVAATLLVVCAAVLVIIQRVGRSPLGRGPAPPAAPAHPNNRAERRASADETELHPLHPDKAEPAALFV